MCNSPSDLLTYGLLCSRFTIDLYLLLDVHPRFTLVREIFLSVFGFFQTLLSIVYFIFFLFHLHVFFISIVSRIVVLGIANFFKNR